MTFRITRWLVRLLYRLIARIEIVGQEHIPVSGGVVAVTNHLGRLDPGLAYCLLDRDDIIMLVAEKYRKVAIFRWLTQALDGIFVDRFNADINAVRTCLKRLRQGGVMIIAPEGTRSPTGALIQARSGAGYLGAKSGAPIVPVAITGTEDAVVKAQLKRLRRVAIRVHFGQVFRLPPVPGDEREKALQGYDDEIMCRIAALLPPERRGVYAEHPRLKQILAAGGSMV
jgi:1-acyl-sn-glycerol-3-phosphate acyltransferase